MCLWLPRHPPIRFALRLAVQLNAPVTGRINAGRAVSSISLRNSSTCRYMCSMVDARAETFEERATKRRRISNSPARTYSTVTAPVMQSTDLPHINLTPTEQALRSLLLDVANYIQQKEGKKEASVLRFTGGWVRDKLLGVNSQDIDVGISDMTGYQFGLAMQEYLAMPGTAEKYARQLSSNGAGFNRTVGSLHKVVANPEKSKHLETCKTKVFDLEIDLVNLRKETYTEESRNPQMEFGTPVEDALRRDATVNALFYNLQTSSVEDFTERGLQDMRDKLIRTPLEPYQTFKDDPLRVLRLIRFASRLGYTIDKETLNAMKNEDIKLHLRSKISPERVLMEIEKTLRGPDPLSALRTIDMLGLYSTIFANHHDQASVNTSDWQRVYTSLNAILDDGYSVVNIPLPLRSNLRRILIRDDNGRYYAWMIAALTPWADVSPQLPLKKLSLSAAVARDSLRCDKKLMQILTSTAQYYQTVSDVKTAFLNSQLGDSVPDIRWKISQYLRTVGKDCDWRYCILQAILMQIMKGGDATNVCRDYEKLLLYIEEQNLLEVDSLKPFVDGSTVSKALGGKKGPWIGKAMEMIVEWQVRNPGTQSIQEALDFVMRRKGELGLE
ncbi:hypothetical protein VTO42DRAFT_3071 [Malbranchea cinnamomea]